MPHAADPGAGETTRTLPEVADELSRLAAEDYRMASEYEASGDTSGNAFAFMKSGRVRLEAAVMIRAALLASSPAPAAEHVTDDACGLSIDMLDVDRLRDWARNLLTYGADVTHWASVLHLASRMQTLATGIEKAVRDIGILRALPAPAAPSESLERLREAAKEAAEVFEGLDIRGGLGMHVHHSIRTMRDKLLAALSLAPAPRTSGAQTEQEQDLSRGEQR